MSEKFNFEGKVAVVTGGDCGLGRAHAIGFARRGAKVLVNDIYRSASSDKNYEATDQLVEEIRAFGGEAVANYEPSVEGELIIQSALDNFDRVDIVINDSGAYRDSSFHKMTHDDWDKVYQAHAYGAYSICKAAWPHMCKQEFGRIINTTSAAGIYGRGTQANFAFAKSGLIGFTNSLAVEGVDKGITANLIAPIATSALTERGLPKELIASLKPEWVTPLVLYLCSKHIDETGSLFEVGAGWVSKLRWQRSRGVFFESEEEFDADVVEGSWQEIVDFSNASHPNSVKDIFNPIFDYLGINQEPS